MLLKHDAGILVVVWVVEDVHPKRLGGGREAEGESKLCMGSRFVEWGRVALACFSSLIAPDRGAFVDDKTLR